jgi:transcriptional regulator with XRE-family HTH domain
MEDFGEQLDRLRLVHGYSIRSFAEKFGHSHTQIRKIIAGDATPNLEWVIKWATHFKLIGDEREQFIKLANSARAKGKLDSADYIEQLERKIKQYEESEQEELSMLEDLVAAFAENELKVPQSVKKRIATLKQRINSTP